MLPVHRQVDEHRLQIASLQRLLDTLPDGARRLVRQNRRDVLAEQFFAGDEEARGVGLFVVEADPLPIDDQDQVRHRPHDRRLFSFEFVQFPVLAAQPDDQRCEPEGCLAEAAERKGEGREPADLETATDHRKGLHSPADHGRAEPQREQPERGIAA
jgi:hypothetical protein